MRARHEHVLDEVVLLRRRAGAPPPPPGLPPVPAHREALDEPAVADGDHHLLFRDHVLDAELFGGIDDLGPPFVSVILLDLKQLFFDDLHLELFALQDRLESLDELDRLAVFVLNLLPLESRQALQPHVQNRLRLDFGQPELLHQARLRRLDILRSPDELHDRIDVVERDDIAFEDMCPFFRLVKLELRPADDDLVPVIDEPPDHFLQREDLRPAVHKRKHDDPEGRLHLRVLVQVVEDHVGVRVAFQVDDDAEPVPVRFVPDVGDILEFLFVDEVGDFLDQVRLVDLVRDLRHDDALAVVLSRFDARLRPHHDAPASGRVCALDAIETVDDPPRREVRRFHELHQLFVRQRLILYQRDAPVHDLAQVVRRDVCRHSHRDAARPVHEEIREHGGEDGGFLEGIVEVGNKIDGVLLEVFEHLLRDAGQTRLGVPHGRRRIAVDGTEIPLAVHERIAHREVLRHTHHRVIHR